MINAARMLAGAMHFHEAAKVLAKVGTFCATSALCGEKLLSYSSWPSSSPGTSRITLM